MQLELETCQKITLTSEQRWEPTSVQLQETYYDTTIDSNNYELEYDTYHFYDNNTDVIRTLTRESAQVSITEKVPLHDVNFKD